MLYQFAKMPLTYPASHDFVRTTFQIVRTKSTRKLTQAISPGLLAQTHIMEELTPEFIPQPEVCTSKAERIEVRVAATEKNAIAAKAKLSGLTVGEYMRRAALGKTVVERVPPELRRQLGGAGNNLNQLAKLANAGKLPGIGIEALNELITRLLQTLK